MSEMLSIEEAVNLVIDGALRGSIGQIEAHEMIWDYDSSSIRPFMNDRWGGVLIDMMDVNPSITWLYGDGTTPYYQAPAGQGFPYTTQYGDNVTVYGVSVGVAGRIDQNNHVWAQIVQKGFDEYGQECFVSAVDALDITDYLSQMEKFYSTEMFLDFGAGYNDNNGEYFIYPILGWYEKDADTGYDMQSTNAGLFCGNSFLHAVQVWGGGQKPQEDDGVTPTGGSGGGGGTYSRADETVETPSLPSINIADIGMSSIYHVTPQQCADFSVYLWSPNGFYDEIIKNMNSPMENIISLNIIPTINLSESASQIVIGNCSSGCNGYKLHTTFYTIDCGTIYVNEYYKNFADYTTEIQIYLPFIGIRDVPVNDCMGGQIKVVYNVDVFSGSCVAFIQTIVGGAWHVIATYNGQISCSIPLSGANYMGIYQGILGAVGSVASLNPMGMAQSIMNASPSYQRSGNIGSMAGLMGIRYPYLIFTTPQIFTAQTFRQNKGYMSNLSGKVSSFSGYVSCDPDKLDLTGLVLMEEEREMLHSILSEGFYV